MEWDHSLYRKLKIIKNEEEEGKKGVSTCPTAISS